MITEDYVSFETAKLLKEKGFDFCCEFQYINCSSGHPFLTDIRDDAGCYYKNSEIGQDEYSAPTLQMAMKWLREKHKITIGIVFKRNRIYYEIHQNNEFVFSVDTPKSYEKVCDEAIKYCLYCLENLI